MTFESGVYQLDIDVERTQHFYAKEDFEFCTCAGCRNFAKAYRLFPEAVQQFFKNFGIDIGKPAEIAAHHSSDGNLTYYDGFYHICGTILAGKDPWLQVGERAYQLDGQYKLTIANDFSVFFTEKCALVDKEFPTPVIQMEIQCSIPWLLEESNPYHHSDV